MSSGDETRTSCRCYFGAASARAKPDGDSFDQTIGNFALVVPSKLDGLSVTDIGFGDDVQTKVTSVSIPNMIKDLDLSGCSALKSVSIPGTVTSICFYGCSALTSVTIPGSVTRIDDYAFGNCSKLSTVRIPKSVTSIGYDAFSGCDRLRTIYLQRGSRLRPGVDFDAPYGCAILSY